MGLQFAERFFVVFFLFFFLSTLFQVSLEVQYLWGEKKKPSGWMFLRPRAPQGSAMQTADLHAVHPGCAKHWAARMCRNTRLEPGQPPVCALGVLSVGIRTAGGEKPGALLVPEGLVGSWAPCKGRMQDKCLYLDAD